MGPEETVRAWVDAQNVALRTGDTADLRSLSSGHCRGCDDFIKPIEQVYRNGGHYETAGWVVEAAKAHGDTDVPVEVDVGVTIAGGKTVLKAGERPISYETEKRILLFKVEPGADGSTVAFVGFVE